MYNSFILSFIEIVHWISSICLLFEKLNFYATNKLLMELSNPNNVNDVYSELYEIFTELSEVIINLPSYIYIF